jgi:hypothetical protein
MATVKSDFGYDSTESNVHAYPRQSVKALRKSVNRQRRAFERELKRQETIVALFKEQLKLSERMIELRSTNQEQSLFSRASEEYRIEKNERRY